MAEANGHGLNTDLSIGGLRMPTAVTAPRPCESSAAVRAPQQFRRMTSRWRLSFGQNSARSSLAGYALSLSRAASVRFLKGTPMPEQPIYPGVYVDEVPGGVRTIAGVPTSITAFVGRALMGPENEPISISTFTDFEQTFGGLWKESALGYAVRDFFLNGGSHAVIVRLPEGGIQDYARFFPPNGQRDKTGIYALEKADLFNLLCIPPLDADGAEGPPAAFLDLVVAYCAQRRAMFIIDPPKTWTDKESAMRHLESAGATSPNAAVYFPRIRQPDPLEPSEIRDFAPCGAVAGIFARTDRERGVWKAPAGVEATLRGVPDLSIHLADQENGELNQLGINCLRIFSGAGRVVWGSRTRAGSDALGSEWKYIPVRRTALFIEESIYRGTQWVVFEPNDEPLWAQIRLNVGAFMHGLFRAGALQGSTPREAYFVKCDRETTTQNDINKGMVNILVGFAPLKPAEFVIIKIQQLAGQIQT